MREVRVGSTQVTKRDDDQPQFNCPLDGEKYVKNASSTDVYEGTILSYEKVVYFDLCYHFYFLAKSSEPDFPSSGAPNALVQMSAEQFSI